MRARSDVLPETPLAPARPAQPPAGTALRAVAPGAATACASPELWAGVHLRDGDAQVRLTTLAASAQRFTPRVSLAPPDGLLLEVRGSLHLFGGVAGLRAALSAECLRHELQPVLAFAPTPLAALAGARAGRALEVLDVAQLIGQLAPLPLSVLRWPDETLARLKLLGVRTVGAVLRLPRAGFARRFGAAQLAVLDRLTGRAPDVRAAFSPRVRFRRRRELDCELAGHDLLRAALAPLFEELGAFLRARQYGVTELECLLMHRQRPVTRCPLRLAAPCADPERLAALLGEHLEALRLPEAVRACELRAQALVPHQPDSCSLWQPGEQGGALMRESAGLIERLQARLGAGAIHGLVLLEGHRPERAWSRSAPPPMISPRAGGKHHARRTSATSDRSTAAPDPAHRRPLWLLSAPQPLAMRDGLPRRRGPLRLVSEPERIESGWWDGDEIARDYYTAVDLHGVRLWIFRERAAPHGWFLHGVFG